MTVQKYSVNQPPIETILAWVKSGEIAIPEIQRPFVWSATKVRNLLDSLYRGYPVGYLIAWRNPTVKLKDGTLSAGKRILIDGQQRVTALMAALLGRDVMTSDYRPTRIKIAFNPMEERFEVHNPAIARDAAWLDDVSMFFTSDIDLFEVAESYATHNPGTDRKTIGKVLQSLIHVVSSQLGLIELADDLDIDTVTEIFIRVNSEGQPLSQADFAMSKIAVNESYGGNTLRKAIDYFCHLATSSEFAAQVEKFDPAFAASEYWSQMCWLKDANTDLYQPSYIDVLRVAFISQFKRGRLQDLVAMLSGRNFETKQYEEAIEEEAFAKLKRGTLAFVNKTHFDRLMMILRSAGFITGDLIRSQNAVNFAYVLYLCARDARINASKIESLVRRWYAMSVLLGRYSDSPESAFDLDVRRISEQGIEVYVDTVIRNQLSDDFWTSMLPQRMESSSSTSPYFIVYRAAQAKLGDRGFLSKAIRVSDLLLNHGDRHHIYPRKFLEKQGLKPAQYNQIANFAITQTEINIAIGDTPPARYFAELAEQVRGGPQRYGGITRVDELEKNLEENCVPRDFLEGKTCNYIDFLQIRRKLMAGKARQWFESL